MKNVCLILECCINHLLLLLLWITTFVYLFFALSVHVLSSDPPMKVAFYQLRCEMEYLNSLSLASWSLYKVIIGQLVDEHLTYLETVRMSDNYCLNEVQSQFS